MEAKTQDGHTTVTMTDTEADELFWELEQGIGNEDVTWKLREALSEDGRAPLGFVDGREEIAV